MKPIRSHPLFLVPLLIASAACTDKEGGDSTPEAEKETKALTVYSGRNEGLVGALFEKFEAESGIPVEVRYGGTAQLAATLLEEGEGTPAEVFVAQDAGALGALAEAGRLTQLPEELLARVTDPRFKSSDGRWVGLSGRARVLAYNTGKVKPEALPEGVAALTDPAWKGRVGWAPTNASFQAFVTALRLLEGEEAAAAWLKGVAANGVRSYKNNTAIIEALSRGEIDVGLVNHYYLHAINKDREKPLPVQNHYFAAGDPGALINVAGVGIIEGGDTPEARKLVEFLLGPTAQAHFATETFEYPLVGEVAPAARIQPIQEVGSPQLDLSKLEDLQGTLRLLQTTGVL